MNKYYDYENTFTETTIGKQLHWLAQTQPNHELAVFCEEGVSYTCQQLDEEVNEVAEAMISIGIGKNTHVGIAGCNSSKWMCVFLACARIGAISVPINANNKHNELEHIISQSDLSYLFMNTSFQKNDLLYEISKVPAIDRLTKIIIFDSIETQILGEEFLFWDDFLLKSKTDDESKVRELTNKVDSNHMFCIHYTSGTTRTPVGAMLKQAGVLNSAYLTGAALHISKTDAVCITVPFFHCFGSIAGILMTIMRGNTMVVIDSYNPLKVLNAIQKHQCTVFSGVPAMFTMMMNYKNFNDYNLDSLHKGIISGSKFPVVLADRIIEVLKMDCLISGWGLTEASAACTLSDIYDPYDKRILTAGRSFPNLQIKIVDGISQDLAPGCHGEICVKGNAVMVGYYNNETETQKVIDEDGWLHTGDIGFIDQEGYCVIIDRIKHIIIRGGMNISPSEVEAEICTHPDIIDAQVVGVPDDLFGEEIAAFIITNEELTDIDVKSYLSTRLDEHKVPVYVFFVDEFITTGSGKVQKAAMRQLAVETIQEKLFAGEELYV